MRKRLSTRALFAIGATALLCGAVLLWRFAPQPSETAVADTAAATATAEPGPAAHGQRPTPSMQVLTVHAQPTRADSSALPPSLRGSQPDGDIRFDDTGGLVIDRGLRHRFDYWLTGLGEVSLKALRERFERSLGTELSPDQIERVLAEFDLYTEYLMAADDLLPVEFGSLVERHRALMALQRQLLGDSRADAWFGEQNRYIDHTLAAMDPGDQNADPIDEPWAAEIDAPTRHHSALALNSPSVRETVSPEILHEQRRRLFGAAAAERLATLDAQRADWNSRLSRFAQARRQVLNQGGPDAAAALGALLEQSFDPAEQRRVLALLDAGLLPTDDGDG